MYMRACVWARVCVHARSRVSACVTVLRRKTTHHSGTLLEQYIFFLNFENKLIFRPIFNRMIFMRSAVVRNVIFNKIFNISEKSMKEEPEIFPPYEMEPAIVIFDFDVIFFLKCKKKKMIYSFQHF